MKYSLEKTYEVEVKSSASALEENNKDLFVLFHVGRTASNIQRSIS